MATLQGVNCTVLHTTIPDEPGYNPSLKGRQATVIYSDGSRQVATKSTVTDPKVVTVALPTAFIPEKARRR